MGVCREFLAAGLLLLADSIAVAQEAEGVQAFAELCAGPAPSHPQVVWRCAHRPYASAKALVADLRNRSSDGNWEPNTRDPALRRVPGKPVWWDCKPGVDPCGYWVRMAPDQYIFVQQLLDYERGNEWLGVGITTFCGGSSNSCQQLAVLAADLVDPSINFLEYASWIGLPPIAPPMPPMPAAGTQAEH